MNTNNTDLDYCLNCKGLIVPYNKVIMYAGPVCCCPKHPDSVYQRPASKEKNK